MNPDFDARLDAHRAEEEQRDREQVEDAMSYEVQYREYRRQQALFQACDPRCYHCGERIATPGECTTDEHDRLIHVVGKCQAEPSIILFTANLIAA